MKSDGGKLVVFDFDGTLTIKDTMIEFTRFYHGNFKFYLGMVYLLPVFLLLKIKIISNWRAKEYFLSFFFRDETITEFQKVCVTFSLEKLPFLIRSSAIQKLHNHRNVGDQIVIVSASAENWLNEWCLQQKITLIATRLEISEGRITGKLLGPNCFGLEKVNRLIEKFNIDKFNEIIVYGNGRGDYELYGISTKYYHKHFN